VHPVLPIAAFLIVMAFDVSGGVLPASAADTAAPALASPANTPDGVTIPAKDSWPKKAVCTVCAAKGGAHGEEKVAGASVFRGAAHYFCSEDCKAEFDADPAGFLPPEFPRPAPAVSFFDASGAGVPLANYKGQVVLVDFWATWCKPCLEVIPDLERLHAEYEDRGLVVVGVSIDEKPEAARVYAEKKKIAYPVLYDTAEAPAWDLFKVKAIPATFLVDRDGNIVAQWTGKPDPEAVESAVAALFEPAGRPD